MVGHGLLTTSLETLLSMRDPNFEVYNEGRIKFKSMLSQDDFLSSTPLEAAYTWTLSTTSAIEGVLAFHECEFTITCNELDSARLFPW